jgi:tetratricopeptide (TPR) repeat protein
LQDRITESVVAAIEPKLQLAEIERLKRKPDANLDAYDLLLRAQQLEYEFTAESLSKAIGLIEQAVRMDPDYAPAMALGAYCHAVRWFQGWTRAPDVEGAEGLRLAMRASELGRDDANVLWMAGYALRELGMDVRGSQELVNRSLQLNPSSAIALTISAWNEIILENPGKALDLLARAERLSPRDPRGWFMFTAAALAYLTQGELEQSVASARKALVQNPRSRQALTMLASSLAQLGDRAGAQKAMKGVLDIEPELTISRLRARLKFMPESIWSRFSSGLRSAGFPE